MASIESKENSKDFLGKRDIMEMFSAKDKWALNLLKFMYGRKLATKINREYYTTYDDLQKFYEEYKGHNIFL